jgi:quinol monooxygenase YgiN
MHIAHHTLKYPAQHVALSEAFVPRAAEHRMIGDTVFDAELAEPAILIRLDNRKGTPMITLDPKSGYVVLINTFTVEPSKAEELLAALSRATEQGMRQRPGFVSANLHISQDRRHVANYAQWRSQADLDTMMQDPAARAHMRDVAAIAKSFDPIYYELRETYSADSRR